MILNSEKSKIMVFENGKGRAKKKEWKWRAEDIKEVKEIKYLGYIIQKNDGMEKQITKRYKRAMVAMKKS